MVARGTPWAALIVNPSKGDIAKLTRVVADAARLHGWGKPRLYETTVEDVGQRVTAQAIADGAAGLFVAGGDGTVRAVCESAAGKGVPLGILPSGTGNLLARNLDLPLDRPGEIAAALFAGLTEPLDVAWAAIGREHGPTDTHAFVVLGGIGADAAMIAKTSATLKKQVGWVAYLEGAARAITNARPFRLLMQVEHRPLQNHRAYSMLFANCGVLPAGIELIPDASTSDGLLDVAIIQPRGALGWLKVWRTVWWENSVLTKLPGNHRRLGTRRHAKQGRRSIEFYTGKWADIAPMSPQPVQLDGDEFGLAARVRCHVDRGAIQVAIPRASGEAE